MCPSYTALNNSLYLQVLLEVHGDSARQVTSSSAAYSVCVLRTESINATFQRGKKYGGTEPCVYDDQSGIARELIGRKQTGLYSVRTEVLHGGSNGWDGDVECVPWDLKRTDQARRQRR